jgi:DNA invertase Pin-like site-specific DNA recombinase
MAVSPDLGLPTAVRCAVYTRKSTAAGLEKDFNSLDAQREACLDYIRSQAGRSWVASEEVYDDGGFTGANIERPGFQKLLEHVRQGLIDVVVIYKVDRLSRSLLDFARVMEHFNRHRTAFVSITQNFSTADPVGRLTLNMLMSFAEFEREMIADRIRDKVAGARRKGKWTGGITSLGYTSEKSKLVVIPTEAPWVAQAFQWYLEGKSALEISQYFNEAEVPMRAIQKPRPHPWNKDHVLRILRNRLYVGEIACLGEFVVAEHPALVTRDVFDQAQRLMKPRHHQPGVLIQNPDYLVRGTLRCGACQGLMTSASTRRDGRVFRYYRCTTRDKWGKKVCPTKQLPAEAIETFVVEQLKEAFQTRARRTALDRYLIRGLGWLPSAFPGFGEIWAALNLRNRQRLIRLLVDEVVVEEAEGTLRIRLRDLERLEFTEAEASA